ncbi:MULTISPECIES: sensor histidine kinase [unclassified Streptomyces]|uniref:sensor histidine kinase n=1 Tax=unclassified Streptomyces TaxID=2593676 RepID=UPI0034500FA8
MAEDVHTGAVPADGRLAAMALAPVRGAVLAVLAALSPLVLAVSFLAALCGLLAPAFALRRFPDLARRLAHAWCGVPPVERPYRPAPEPPRPDTEGRFRIGSQLYRTASLPAYLRRVEWLARDPATHREALWLALNPPVAAVTVLLPAALVAAGLLLTTAGRGPLAAAAGPVLVLAGPACGPSLLAVHGRWTRSLLGPRPEPARRGRAAALRRTAARYGRAVLRLWATALLSVVGAVLAAGTVLCLVPGAGWPLAGYLRVSRAFTEMRRRQVAAWTGVEIASPYTPPPPPPEPRADGTYQAGRTLYRSPRPVVRLRRYAWALRSPATWRDLLWHASEPVAALLPGAAVALLVGYGFLGLVWPWLWVVPLGPWVSYDAAGPWTSLTGWLPFLRPLPAPLFAPLLGTAAALAGCAAAPRLLALHARWSRLLLAPTPAALLARRIDVLREQRDGTNDAQAAVLRRIERDLHDGAQASWVAVGMKLDSVDHLMADRPEEARQLLGEAREGLAKGLRELRHLVRGIHPPVLAERGLGDAVRALALDVPLEVEAVVELPGRADPAIESAVYFTVGELLANVVKHARASRVRVELWLEGDELTGAVCDDGRGGADPAAGGGLAGLRTRLAPFDGVLEVDSPPGGPTRVEFRLPLRPGRPPG